MHGRIRTVLEMIKFEHSVFALPFALVGALLAARETMHGWPTLRQILWIVVAMVAARSAAMTINRIVDLRYDKENPRTKMRALATGALSVSFAWAFTLAAITLFFVAAWELNPLALELAPVALAVLFFYSYTKRFTHWSHIFLGFALGISPAAAWIAITGSLDWRMIDSVRGSDFVGRRLRCAVRLPGYSVRCRGRPVLRAKAFGSGRALLIARVMHVWVVILLSWLAASFGLPWPAWAGIGGCGGAAGVRAFAGETERPEQAERCVFRRERLY